MTVHESTDTWTEPINLNVLELGLDITKSIIISFTAKDTDPGHWVEAGLDVFRVNEGMPSSSVELVGLEKMSIYPNPADDQINIKTEIKDIELVKIYDLEGKTLISKAYESKIDVSTLVPGSYMIVFIKTNGDILSSQLVKK